jgi:dienelactone hydrolase
MHAIHLWIGAILSTLTLTAAIAQQAPSPEVARAQVEMRARQNSMPDTRGSGKFPALKEEVASLPDHVIYRPANLTDLGDARLGLYIFGNGGCSDDGASSRLHLLEIASHGYLAIAPGRILSGPGIAPRPVPPPPPALTARTSYKELMWAIDWALAQNANPNSAYHNRIDPNAIAVSGFSCGGVQALRVGADPRVKTVIGMNTGLFTAVTPLPEMDVPKSALNALHSPVFYLLGGETDIAYPNGSDDFKRINHVPVFYANLLGVGHGGTYWEPNGGKAAAAVVAWLEWQLRGDTTAARMFVGKDCTLCTDKAWSVEKKKID